jgi:hypothetical protein
MKPVSAVRFNQLHRYLTGHKERKSGFVENRVDEVLLKFQRTVRSLLLTPL